METVVITVTLQAQFIHIRAGRPEDFGLDYHIQRDDYLRLELPDNPRCVDIFLMATKAHPQQQRIVEIVAIPCLDMLMNGQSAPQWSHPAAHTPEGGILIHFSPE